MSHSWLQKKRKGELLELAQRANVPDADQLLKDDLVVALEEHLHANESIFAKQPEFSDFYGRAGSPVKRERSSPSAVAAADALVTTKARRRTLLKRDSEESTPVKTAVATRTPRVASRASRLSEVEIPASPAQLADVADRHFQAIGTKVVDAWEGSRIDDAREWLRENVSSVSAIQMLILVIEGAGLQYNQVSLYPVLVPGLGKKVDVPNVWGLLEAHWWARATLWTATSWLLPLIVSYFFNLTLRSNTHHKSPSRQYKIDPLTFNIAKAFLAYCAFYIPTQPDAQLAGQPNQISPQRVAWGPWAEQTVSDVRANVPGGYNGLQIGAFVGILVSLYDAALKK